jgi:hypothetical protein
MKKQTVRILFGILFIGFMLAVPVNQVFASMANISASLDWSQLSIIGSLNWASKSTDTNATVSNSFGETGAVSDQKPGWVSSSSAVTISNANAQGTSTMPQSLSSASYSNLNDKGWSSSSGSAILTATFIATDDGWITIYLPFTISMNLSASSDPTASAYGKTRASVSLAQSDGTTTTEFMEFFSTVSDGNSFEKSRSGIFGLIRYFEAGKTGTFTAEVSTETANSNMVPLPGALWLFAPGLACFVGLRRRLNKQ